MGPTLNEVVTKLHQHIESTNRYSRGSPQAGVLVPLFSKLNEAHVLLTVRASTLRKHSGQISFPGGKIEDQDDSIIDTALRETQEEIGLSRNHIDIINKFHDFATPHYSCVTPVLATFDYPNEFDKQETEIAKILEVPISALLDPRIHHTETRVYQGKEFTLHFYNWKNGDNDYQIWGATAGVLTKILNIIRTA